MESLASLIIAFLGIMLFIYLLPTLLWLLGIFLIVIFVYVLYQKHKMQKYMKDMQNPYEEVHYYESTTSQNDRDIIDVEYSESEEDER